MADFFNASSVDEVDLLGYTGAVGDKIVVRASDDFDPSITLPSVALPSTSLGTGGTGRAGVVGVRVAITKADGTAIEEGAATETPADSGRWVYTATTAVATGTTVRIAVTATDRPGGGGEGGVASGASGASGGRKQAWR
jgi:hypothetical protein